MFTDDVNSQIGLNLNNRAILFIHLQPNTKICKEDTFMTKIQIFKQKKENGKKPRVKEWNALNHLILITPNNQHNQATVEGS